MTEQKALLRRRHAKHASLLSKGHLTVFVFSSRIPSQSSLDGGPDKVCRLIANSILFQQLKQIPPYLFPSFTLPLTQEE